MSKTLLGWTVISNVDPWSVERPAATTSLARDTLRFMSARAVSGDSTASSDIIKLMFSRSVLVNRRTETAPFLSEKMPPAMKETSFVFVIFRPPIY